MQQITKFRETSAKGPLLKSQIVLYSLATVYSLILLGLYARAFWLYHHPATTTATPAPVSTIQSAQAAQQPTQAAPVETSAPVVLANPAAAASESLDSEVARVVPTLNKWTPAVLDASHMADYGSARMADLEGWKSSTFARNVADWPTMPDVPVLSGRYEVKQAAESNWPVPGSLAVEVVPTEGDVSGKSDPWRAVIFLAAPSGASDAVLYRYLLNSYSAPGAREVILGRAHVPAVPVAWERIGATGRTFYCVVPAAQATIRVAATEVVQRIRPQAALVAQAQQPTPAPAAAATPAADPVAARYSAWKTLRDAYAKQQLVRAQHATTDAEKGQIQREITLWRQTNPEPPKPQPTPTEGEIPIR